MGIAECAEGSSCTRRVLRIRFCKFVQNRGSIGGALFLEDTRLVVRNSTFVRNEADLAGGAVYMNNHRLRSSAAIRSSVFKNNRAHGRKPSRDERKGLGMTKNDEVEFLGKGGAIYAHNVVIVSVMGSAFSRNVGCRGGGGIAILTSAPDNSGTSTFHLNVTDSHFEENQAFCGSQNDALISPPEPRGETHLGGALYGEHGPEWISQWSVTNTSFQRNRARFGGSVAIRASGPRLSKHVIQSCVFEQDVALSSGGSIALECVRLTMRNTIVQKGRAVYGGGIMLWKSSILVTEHDPTDLTALSILKNNVAMYGGGILADFAGNLVDASHSACIRVLLR